MQEKTLEALQKSLQETNEAGFIHNPYKPLNAYDFCSMLPFGSYILICKTDRIFLIGYQACVSHFKTNPSLELYLSQYQLFRAKCNRFYSLLRPIIKKFGFRFTVVIGDGIAECFYLFKKTFITNITTTGKSYVEYENALRTLRNKNLEEIEKLGMSFEQVMTGCKEQNKIFRLLYFNKVAEGVLQRASNGS